MWESVQFINFILGSVSISFSSIYFSIKSNIVIDPNIFLILSKINTNLNGNLQVEYN